MIPGLQSIIPWPEFEQRRQRLASQMGVGTAVLMGAGPVRAFDAFRQNKELLYLCGVQIPMAYLTVSANGEAVLYVPDQPAEKALGDRPFCALEAEEVCAVTGLTAVRNLEQLPLDLAKEKVVWVPFAPLETPLSARDVLQYADRIEAQNPFGPIASRERQFLAHLAAALPQAEVRNLTPLLDPMRLIKTEAELQAMRIAGQLSARAVERSMKVTRPGIGEHELEGLVLQTFLAGGAQGMGYKSIIPGGSRMWDGHYTANDQIIADGELVLMDCAPDYHGYTSDIGRTWPVNGKFAPWQRELYGFVDAVHEETLSRIRPGVEPQQVLDEVKSAMLPTWESTRWSKPTYQEATRALLDFRGTFSHPVGLAVHDVGSYWGRPMEPGLVFTIDPMIWVHDERLYIRVEDTVAVTDQGVEVLTQGPPRSPEAIEAYLAEG